MKAREGKLLGGADKERQVEAGEERPFCRNFE